jgi:hypothetical protein
VPGGKLLVVMLIGVTVFTGELGVVELEPELVPELHPLATKSGRSNAKQRADETVFVFSGLGAEVCPRHVNLVMKLLTKSCRYLLGWLLSAFARLSLLFLLSKINSTGKRICVYFATRGVRKSQHHFSLTNAT